MFSAVLLTERDFVAMFWSIFLVTDVKQTQSSCWFSFNLLCEWFFDQFHQKIEVIGQILRWEWRMETPCLGARSGSLNKTLVSRRPLDSSLGVDARDWNETQHCIFLRNIVNWIINISRIFGLQTCTVIMSDQDKLLPVKSWNLPDICPMTGCYLQAWYCIYVQQLTVCHNQHF